MKMRKGIFIIMACLTFLIPKDIFAAELTANSKITGVTVYQDRALVTRYAEVNLEKGDNAIVFENLPSGLMEESLRAQGKATSVVTIYGAELKRAFSAGEVNPNVDKITQELEKLQYDLKNLQQEYQALGDQKTFLDSIKNFSSVQIPKEIMTKTSPPSDWTGLSKFLLESYTENGAKMILTEKAIADKNKEIQAKQEELNNSGRPRDIEKKTVLVNVNASDRASFKLELSYVVPQATWNISYDARVYPDKKLCSVVSYGNVRQWSGEDWNEVSLTLSSAKPAIGGKMPELDPWYVDFWQVYEAKAKKATFTMMALSRSAGSAASEDEAMAEAELAQSAASQELGSVTFQISRATTITGDNHLYKQSIKTDDFETMLDYEATPKILPYAFIHSKVVNNKDISLIAGDMNIFVNDNFIAKSSIPTIGRDEKFDLYLGIDEEIKVKRTALIDKMRKALLGLRARKDYGYKIELENYKKENVKITVIDQLPVSKNADIKAELTSTTLKPTETKDLGILKWTLELAPKEKKAFEFQFFVEYPSDKNISGV